MGIVWETTWVPFVVITLLLSGGAAWLSGQSMARGWRPVGLLIFYMVLLGFADRFFHWGLAQGSLLSIHYYVVDTAILIAIAVVSWQAGRTRQMTTQYPWLYRRTSFLTWADK